MATLTAGETRAAAPKAKAAEQVQVAAPNRREFLYYIWGASIALLLGEAGAAFIWFALPRFKEGTFGGIFSFPPDRVPQVDTFPSSEPAGRFHVSNVEDGLVVLYGVCTHLGCLPKWVEATHRFECPCHGSKFELSGRYIEGPAPRSLDRFETTVFFTDGTSAVTNASGDPIPIAGKTIERIAINTGRRINRGDKS